VKQICLTWFVVLMTLGWLHAADFELVTVSINRPEEQKAVLEVLKKNQASCRNFILEKQL